ncbi:MAG: glycosyltransferase family 2 protein [Oscillospiraceae bacterium]|nr:glycosyltransferase family 2 protein [Oscillospiraceae bacterium]
MISIFTPTYNRAYVLPKLYESLCSQTVNDFEWIVIDDGSTDNTEELVKAWVESGNHFEIIYKKKENGGKQRAINDAAKIARYDWFHIVDSDDFLMDSAVERVIYWVKTIKNDPAFGGVMGLMAYASTNEIVGAYPKGEQYVDATFFETEKYSLLGDKSPVIKTELYRKYPYPEYEGETFITEAIFCDKLGAEGYKFRWFNEVICKIEYLEDGLTNNIKSGSKVWIDNFEGFTHFVDNRLQLGSWSGRQEATVWYFLIAKEKGLGFFETKKKLRISTIKIFIAAASIAFLRPGKIINRLRRKR